MVKYVHEQHETEQTCSPDVSFKKLSGRQHTTKIHNAPKTVQS